MQRVGNVTTGSFAYYLAQNIDATAQSLIIEKDIYQAQRTAALLRMFQPKWHVELFPDYETLPFDSVSPPIECISQRFRVLRALAEGENIIVVASCSTAMHYLPPKPWLVDAHFSYKTGDTLDTQQFSKQLVNAGYSLVSTVLDAGQFAVRGAIFDLFPVGSPHPFRLELFDNICESIRIFDVESQRTISLCDSISMLPTQAIELSESNIMHFRSMFYQKFPNSIRHDSYRSISDGKVFAGIEYFIPWLHQQPLDTLWDYMQESCQCFYAPSIKKSAQQFEKNYRQRYSSMIDFEQIALDPSLLFLTYKELLDAPKMHAQWLYVDKQPDSHNASLQKIPALAYGFKGIKHLQKQHAQNIICAVESARYIEQCRNELGQLGIISQVAESWQQAKEFNLAQQGVALIIAPIEKGFIDTEKQLVVLSQLELFDQPAIFEQKSTTQQSQVQHKDFQTALHSISQLEVGSPVVHIEYGVGRYDGLHTVNTSDEQQQDFIRVLYAEQESLYLPIASTSLLSPYIGNPDEAPLHKLTANRAWKKEREKAEKNVEDIAAHLLDAHARRTMHSSKSIMPDERYQKFCTLCPFIETEGQQKAIQDVLTDMKSNIPMDRLVCGDVGFGKTEVAIRAAFVAASAGVQVALLVPTTLLANQHYEQFQDRMTGWPIRIGLLSRLQNSSENESVLERLRAGKLDIVIGTHRLLQKDVQFPQLGLLIIDEEHRFGVKQKEQFKHMRSQVNILAMTATPIPRTLNIAFSKLREISVIATPPPGRVSIKTFVRNWDNALIKTAIERELQRGGQVFFVHNNIKSLQRIKHDLQKILPAAQIGIAHGQMVEREMAQVMADFHHQRQHVLLCTTIIENGIDMANVNTIIINRADQFGLAQLHQLRGRVGRSTHQAYAYFITPDITQIKTDAKKRLNAIAKAHDLGAGFQLAIQDLEIRGAGELLGDQQKGHIQKIGFNLYMEMLARAVDNLSVTSEGNAQKSSTQAAADIKLPSEINLGFSAIIPDEYIDDVPTRLQFYQRMNSTQNIQELDVIRAELLDRFGSIPQVLEMLFETHSIRHRIGNMGIKRIDAFAERIYFELYDSAHFNHEALVQHLQEKPSIWNMKSPKILQIKRNTTDAEQRIAEVIQVIDILKPNRTK